MLASGGGSRAGAWRRVALLAWAAAVLAGCTAGRAARTAGPAHVSTAPDLTVRRGDFEDRFLLTGELKAVHSYDILVPRTPSWQLPIRWMEADGTAVTQGQRVLELDNAAFAGTLEQHRFAASQAANELHQREADIEAGLAQRTYAVEQARFALEKARIEAEVPEDILPQRTYQERQLALERAKATLANANEDLASYKTSSESELAVRRIALDKARREIATAEKAIGELTLTAPRSGILVVGNNPQEWRKLQVGDTVWVGLTVMSIPDLSEMKVEARLSDVDQGRIAIGMPVRCTLDTWPDKVFEGTVAGIAEVAQEASWRSMRRDLLVDIRLKGSDPDRMSPGMSVKVEVDAGRRDGVLLAPRAGLDLTASQPRARLKDGGDSAVRLGACNAELCIVEDGLVEGTMLRSEI